MERPHCPTHGLVVGDEGCLGCRRETEATPARGRFFVEMIVGLVVLAALGAFAVRVVSVLTDPQARTASPDPPPAPAPSMPAVGYPSRPVRVAAAPATAHGPNGTRTPVVATATTATATKAVTSTGASREALIAAEMKSVPVTLYSADYCPWCRKAKAHMDSRGIWYSERHVDESPAAEREMARIGGRSIPTIDIEGDVHSGYDPAWVERTLRAHAERRVAGR